MRHTHLATLREMLRSRVAPGECWRYYLDHLADDGGFLALGEGVRESRIERTVEQFARDRLMHEPAMTDCFLLRVSDQRFVHGGLTLNDWPCAILYCEDLDLGLLVYRDVFFPFQLANLPPLVQQ